MLTDNAGSLQLVLSIDDIEGKSIRWSSSPAKYFIDTNKWSKIIHTFYANSSINWHNKIIKTYIWNPSKNKAYIDDFSISFY
jgi:hypothetical protein